MAHSFTTNSYEIWCQKTFWNFLHTGSQESRGQGQTRGVGEPRMDLLMEPSLFRGGSINRTYNNKLGVIWVFSLKMYQFVRENWVAADSQRQRNNLNKLEYNSSQEEMFGNLL